jgi:hypothetical protein
MFNWLKRFKRTPTTAASHTTGIVAGVQFTIESLWNDFELRTYDYAYLSPKWESTNPRLLNWIGSVDRSGYTREKCLNYLITHFTAGDENRILLRLSDWVPNIQESARNWILANFDSLPFDSIRANSLLILYLSRRQKLQTDTAISFLL